jgi:hypothetical protein
MSDDEIILFGICGFFALAAWGRWYFQITRVHCLRSSKGIKSILSIAPMSVMLFLHLVMMVAASHDVQDNLKYQMFYDVMGVAWVGIGVSLTPIVGFYMREDAIERRNRPACAVFVGVLFGLAFCFAGANIGDGPGYGVVLLCAGCATGVWFLGWIFLEVAGRVSESVSIERDAASGARVMGFLMASGIILGRGAAGDWLTHETFWKDFLHYVMLYAVLLAGAALIEIVVRPRPRHDVPSLAFSGVIPFVIFMAYAAYLVIRSGPLESW